MSHELTRNMFVIKLEIKPRKSTDVIALTIIRVLLLLLTGDFCKELFSAQIAVYQAPVQCCFRSPHSYTIIGKNTKKFIRKGP